MSDHRLLEIVDNWFSDPKSINEGGYLEICNLLKKNFDSNPDKLKEELKEEKEDRQELLVDYNELMDDRNKVMDDRNELMADYNKLMDDYNKRTDEYYDCVTRKGILLSMIMSTEKSEDSDKKFSYHLRPNARGFHDANYNDYLAKLKERAQRALYPVIIDGGFSFNDPITNEYIMHHNHDSMVWNDIFLQRSCHTHATRAAGKTADSFCQAAAPVQHTQLEHLQMKYTWGRSWRFWTSICSQNKVKDERLYGQWHTRNRHMNCEDNVLRLLFG